MPSGMVESAGLAEGAVQEQWAGGCQLLHMNRGVLVGPTGVHALFDLINIPVKGTC